MHTRKVSVNALGYVNLLVAVAFGKQAITIGFDVNEARLAELRDRVDRTNEVVAMDLELTDILLSGHQSIKISENVALPELPESLVVRRVNKYSLLFSNRFPTRSVMVKQEVSYRFLPEKCYAEDYLLWLTIVFNGQPAWFLNSPMAYSFKEDFGGGLAGNLWETQLGVLDTYHRVFSIGFISIFMFTLVSCFSFFKYLRWLDITKVRSLFNGRVTNSEES